jgi:NAD kinase
MILGGDSSYLRAAGLINSRNIPILGINSDPTRRTGALLNADIDFKNQGYSSSFFKMNKKYFMD